MCIYLSLSEDSFIVKVNECVFTKERESQVLRYQLEGEMEIRFLSYFAGSCKDGLRHPPSVRYIANYAASWTILRWDVTFSFVVSLINSLPT